MRTILSKPWRIDRRGERIYIDAPGEVCIDLCSGTPEGRARVMALLENARGAFRTLVDYHAGCGCRQTMTDRTRWCHVARLLDDAGVLDESDPHGRVGP